MRENPLSYPPHDESSVMERPSRKLEAAGRYYSIPPTRIIPKRGERHPEGIGDLVAQDRL